MLLGVYAGLAILGVKFFWGPYPHWMAFVVPMGNILETSLSYFIFRRFVPRPDPGFANVRQLALFLLLCPWIPALCSALSIQSLLQQFGTIPPERIWSEVVVYSLGNATGILLVTPLILVWRDFIHFSWKSKEGIQLGTLVVVILMALWFYSDFTPAWMRLLAIAMIPLAVWGVWSTGIRGATIACLLGSVSYFAFDVPGSRPLSQLLEIRQKGAELEFELSRNIHGITGPKPTPQTVRLISDQIGLLTVICITILPLGVASDELRQKANRDRIAMATLSASFWNWTAEAGNEIENPRIARLFLPWAKLFHLERKTGSLKIRPADPGAPLFLSHWVIQETDASGRPIRVTGILQNYAMEEERDAALAQARLSELEIQTLRSHLNPHLLFNCLTGLRGLIAEDPAKARKFSGNLANFLRAVVDSEKQKTVSLQSEMDICQDFAALEELRGRPIGLNIQMEAGTDNLAIPPLTVVSLLENASKHGERNPGQPMPVNIVMERQDSRHIRILIRQPGKLKPDQHELRRAGTDLIRRHLAMVYGADWRLDLAQDSPDTVLARLVVPA